MPKSVTTAAPPESSMFSGLMSRCTTPSRVRVRERARDVAQNAHRLAIGERRSARRGARAAIRRARTASCSTAGRRRRPRRERERCSPAAAAPRASPRARTARRSIPRRSSGAMILTTTSRPSGFVARDEHARHSAAAELALDGVRGSEVDCSCERRSAIIGAPRRRAARATIAPSRWTAVRGATELACTREDGVRRRAWRE